MYKEEVSFSEETEKAVVVGTEFVGGAEKFYIGESETEVSEEETTTTARVSERAVSSRVAGPRIEESMNTVSSEMQLHPRDAERFWLRELWERESPPSV